MENLIYNLLPRLENLGGIDILGHVSHEKPFRQGDNTTDDVSLFLLREFEAKLSG